MSAKQSEATRLALRVAQKVENFLLPASAMIESFKARADAATHEKLDANLPFLKRIGQTSGASLSTGPAPHSTAKL
jgi:hypothetical protein